MQGMTDALHLLYVEFYGIPRARAGVAETTVELPGPTATLAEVLQRLGTDFPKLGAECIAGNTLREGYAASVGGERFIRSPGERLHAGETLLVISADAGG